MGIIKHEVMFRRVHQVAVRMLRECDTGYQYQLGDGYSKISHLLFMDDSNCTEGMTKK